MSYKEWREAELGALKDELRLMGYVPEAAEVLIEAVQVLMDTAYEAEFEEDVVH